MSTQAARPRLHIGMSFDNVCAVLGPPDDMTSGGDIFGARSVVLSAGDPAAARSRTIGTKWCVWRRPEGMYMLMFEQDMLTKAVGAPEGAVGDVRMKHDGLPARFVLIATNGAGEYPREIVDRMVRQKQLLVTPDVVIQDVVSAGVVSMEDQGIVGYAGAAALSTERELGRDLFELESMRIMRFKDPRHPRLDGVLVTISGPASDPKAAEVAQIEARRDVCCQCGITWEERLKAWDAPAPPGVVKIDNGEPFLFCPRCKAGVCGACSVDLGMSAGCPVCETELVRMDGTPQ